MRYFFLLLVLAVGCSQPAYTPVAPIYTPAEPSKQEPLHMGVGINIHLKGSNEPIKVWYGDKTEAELRKKLRDDFAKDGRTTLEASHGKTIDVEKDNVLSIEYKKMSDVQWILDAGNL
jgi:hypothetical protein